MIQREEHWESATPLPWSVCEDDDVPPAPRSGMTLLLLDAGSGATVRGEPVSRVTLVHVGMGTVGGETIEQVIANRDAGGTTTGSTSGSAR